MWYYVFLMRERTYTFLGGATIGNFLHIWWAAISSFIPDTSHLVMPQPLVGGFQCWGSIEVPSVTRPSTCLSSFHKIWGSDSKVMDDDSTLGGDARFERALVLNMQVMNFQQVALAAWAQCEIRVINLVQLGACVEVLMGRLCGVGFRSFLPWQGS